MKLHLPRPWAFLILLLAGAQLPWLWQVRANAAQPRMLRAESFRHHIDRFNREDDELYANTFPNAASWEFLKANIPLFECPDQQIERTYYFRFWTYRKHLKKTPDGWVVTEFLPDVPWSGKHNTICCPAGHHFYEGRWLHDRKYLDDYAAFWFRKGGSPRLYSFWAADALYARYLVDHDKNQVIDLLETLKIYTKSHRRKLDDGRVVSWIDENINPFTGDWIARTRCEERNAELRQRGEKDRILLERGKDYNHSSYCDLIITGLVGLRPRADDVVEVNPLIPEGKWDFFCLDNVRYHGHRLTVLWDTDGNRYGKGSGLHILTDGRPLAHRETLGRLTGRLPAK